MFLVSYLLEKLINKSLCNNIMNLEEINKLHHERYKSVKKKIFIFSIIVILLIVPACIIFPRYIQIRYLFGILMLNTMLFGVATLKQKEIM